MYQRLKQYLHRKVFVLVCILLVLLGFNFLYNLKHVCNRQMEQTKIKTKDGRFLQKHNEKKIFKSFGELNQICRYIDDKIHCPDVRHKGETIFRQSQLVMTRMLAIIDAICQKHGIEYWIAYGTLLGAHRHGTNIPWDHDIDIQLLREDYLKLIRIIRMELPGGLYFQDGSDEAVFARSKLFNAKIRDLGSCYGSCMVDGYKFNEGLQIDIFVHRKEVRKTTDGEALYNLVHDFFDMAGSTLPYENVFPLRRMMFDGVEVYAPRNVENILKLQYGDGYMNWPSEQSRCPDAGCGYYIPMPEISCEYLGKLSLEERRKVINEYRIY